MTPEAEAEWEKMTHDPVLQQIAAEIFEFTSARVSSTQIEWSDVDIWRGRYRLRLSSTVSKKLFVEVIVPEARYVATRRGYWFGHSSCFPEKKGFVIEVEKH